MMQVARMFKHPPHLLVASDVDTSGRNEQGKAAKVVRDLCGRKKGGRGFIEIVAGVLADGLAQEIFQTKGAGGRGSKLLTRQRPHRV
jgi:hypothetical protein